MRFMSWAAAAAAAAAAGAACAADWAPAARQERETIAVASFLDDAAMSTMSDPTGDDHFVDDDGSSPKQAGCLRRYADAACEDAYDAVIGDSCVEGKPTELMEAVAYKGQKVCDAKQCCEEYAYIAFNCPGVCGNEANKRFVCRPAPAACGGKGSAACDCSGGAIPGPELEPL